MARTKQTVRKLTGGKAPRKQVSSLRHKKGMIAGLIGANEGQTQFRRAVAPKVCRV